jgi:DNA ligase D-like protein (predicted 3'-phosphoesterase)
LLNSYSPRRQPGAIIKLRSNSMGRLRFVIHKHDASRLHYDLRLEKDGVLKSWAVPKEPPSDFGTKRLAVAVDDHEAGYISFEGTIPEGEYGAGTVEIWDAGEYELIECKTGEKWVLELFGNRIKGRYALVRMKNKGEKNWLFFRTKA